MGSIPIFLTNWVCSLRKSLNETGIRKAPTEVIISTVDFAFKNSYFEFNEIVCRQISGTAIGTSFAPPYACTFMDEMEISFLKRQQLTPFIWLRYIDDIFFRWTHCAEKLKLFLKDLNEFHTNLTFKVNFLGLNVSLKDGANFIDLYIKPTIY